MNEDLLAEAVRLADTVFRPRAEETDQGTVDGQLRENVELLRNAGYFGLGIPRAYGGMEADDATKREYVEVIASSCGVTAFTQQNLQSGGGFVSSTENTALKDSLLPSMAKGDILCGIAFSHLRRPGKALLSARPVNGGYVIDGVAPWVTGWKLMQSFILGAALPEHNRHLYFYVEADRNNPKLSVAPTPKLVSMNASDTVALEFDGYFLPDDSLLFDRDAGDLARADLCGISGHVHQPLGCARGAAIYLRSLAESRNRVDLIPIAEKFEHEINQCRHEALTWNGSCVDLPDYKERALRARTTTILLAVRAAHATVAATGGSAHYMTQPPQRLLREAIFYTTVAQTREIQSGTLDLLVSSECWREA